MKKTTSVILTSALLLSLLTSCGAFSNLDGGGKGYAMDKVYENITEANTDFAFNIFRKLNEEDSGKSIFISPLSISTALTMTYVGAEGSTREAMREALGYTNIDDYIINESYRNLLAYLQSFDKSVELDISNSIWIREGAQVKEDFKKTNKDNYFAEVTSINFDNPSAADVINKWISRTTKGKIDKMIEPPIDPDVLMYLINTIYFKGDWKHQFKEKDTVIGTFNTAGGKQQQVSMMQRQGTIEFTQNDDYKAVSLPYGDGKISMTAVLPADNKNMKAFVEAFDSEKWQEIQNSIAETDDVVLQMPKFKLEYGIKSLKDSLTFLEMGEAFGGNADFSGIRDITAGQNLYISDVLHKAVIEVNEKGSEAAAATVVEMRDTGYTPPREFIADRPFIFIISDNETGSILFMGILNQID